MVQDLEIRYHDECPICNKKLIDSSDSSQRYFECQNECYTMISGIDRYGESYTTIYIFEIPTVMSSDNFYETNKQLEISIRNKIEYWRENDRYLVRILTGDGKNEGF